MLQSFINAKVKSCASIALLSMLLLLPTVPFSSGQDSGVWLIYDRNDPDSGHSGTDPLAVRFTPHRIWLGMGKTCTLFKITAIELNVVSDSWIWNAGFDVHVTDKDHQVLKSFLNQHPTEDGWFNVPLTGWTDESRYVDTHFFVEFQALPPVDQESWAILWFDEAVIDEGEASYGRSYRYTYGPENPNPNIPAWLPIELTYPYGPGDLMIRVKLEPQMPETVLPSLIDTISAADPIVFKGQAPSVKATLIKKIGEAISMFEKGNYIAGLNKLENDIAQKLADPRPTPSTSWLQPYKEGSHNQELVTSFAVACQHIVQMVQKSALPPGILERCDFDNDGYDDLAIGVPHEDVSGKDDAGAINVLYGSPEGVSQAKDEYFHPTNEHDNFGAALAFGNFNGDEYDDLAIGIPYADLTYPKPPVDHNVGVVDVLYGSASGLSGADDEFWWQNLIAYTPRVSEPDDHFGTALAAGDFDGDGYDDLAIGVPGEDNGAGEVDVLYGSPTGLTTGRNQVWNQDPLGGIIEAGDSFGESLTVGNFNGDSYEDLVIGVPHEEVGGIDDAGAVNVVYGSSGGLTAVGNQLWHQDSSPLIGPVCEANDLFGGSLAAGDFNGDGYDDLAIGVPGENEHTGFVEIFYGSSIGLSAAGNKDIAPIYWIDEEDVTEFEYFGASLAVGDFDHDGYEDLAVGVPGANIEWENQLHPDAGAVFVTYGSLLGVFDPLSDLSRWDIWLEVDLLLPFQFESNFANNLFGRAVTTGDFNGDGFCDLAIGVPGADATAFIGDDAAGMVKVMYGYPSGLSTAFFSSWYQDKSGVLGDSEGDDYFGSSLPGSQWRGLWP